uniref:39S ribosomal protein L55, mitochondrial n=1 Tax=Poecilia mexicana TaxID=48701 RepID=A0A3B3WKX2_9TELE
LCYILFTTKLCRKSLCICPCISLAGSQPVSPAVPTSFLHSHGAQLSSNRTSLVRCGRQKYERQYPVLLVRPDGSTVSIRYQEPRRLLLVSDRLGLSPPRGHRDFFSSAFPRKRFCVPSQ